MNVAGAVVFDTRGVQRSSSALIQCGASSQGHVQIQLWEENKKYLLCVHTHEYIGD